MSQLLNATDAAKKLGSSRYSLYAATRTYGIPHVRIGRSMRWDDADLDRYIAMLKTKTERCPTCGQSVRHLRNRKARSEHS